MLLKLPSLNKKQNENNEKIVYLIFNNFNESFNHRHYFSIDEFKNLTIFKIFNLLLSQKWSNIINTHINILCKNYGRKSITSEKVLY
jgi:hypothetical protein